LSCQQCAFRLVAYGLYVQGISPILPITFCRHLRSRPTIVSHGGRLKEMQDAKMPAAATSTRRSSCIISRRYLPAHAGHTQHVNPCSSHFPFVIPWPSHVYLYPSLKRHCNTSLDSAQHMPQKLASSNATEKKNKHILNQVNFLHHTKYILSL
jgi:hypothetical protein